jgi:hypothetical protein
MRRRVTEGEKQRLAGRDHVDSAEQVGRLDVLQEEAAGPRAQRLEDVLVSLEGGQDDDPDLRQVVVGGDLSGRFEPVHLRHPDVHEDHVRAVPAGQLHSLPSLGGLSHDLDAAGGLQEDSKARPDER